MLCLQKFMNALIGKIRFGFLARVRNCSLSDTLPLDENQRLHQQIAGVRFTLHVVNRVIVLDVSVKTEDRHGRAGAATTLCKSRA